MKNNFSNKRNTKAFIFQYRQSNYNLYLNEVFHPIDEKIFINLVQEHTQLVTFTSCEKTDDCDREDDAESKLSSAVDEQVIENQKPKFMSDAISLNEEVRSH